MGKLIFGDGVEFEMDVPLHTERRNDGLYVVGEGMVIPVKDDEEANYWLTELKKTRDRGEDVGACGGVCFRYPDCVCPETRDSSKPEE